MNTRKDRMEAHKAKMTYKAEVRAAIYNGRNFQWDNDTHCFPASINRHTEKPHADLREKARRRFAAGTIDRGVGYADAKEGKELVFTSYGHLNTGKRHKKVGQAYLNALAKEPF